MIDKRDYYDVLGVSRDTSDEDLKKAYLKLAARHLPDETLNDKVTEEKFTEAGEAYEVLSSRDKRAVYDRYGYCAFTNNGGFRNPYEIFDEAFGGGMFESKRNQPQIEIGATTNGKEKSAELGKRDVENAQEPKHVGPVGAKETSYTTPDKALLRKGSKISIILGLALMLSCGVPTTVYGTSSDGILGISLLLAIAGLIALGKGIIMFISSIGAE